MSTIYWLRNDLRLHDNECLHRAIHTQKPLLMVYCFDPRHYAMLDLGFRKTGYLRHKYLCETLENLKLEIEAKGGKLMFLQGEPENVLPELVRKLKSSHLIYQKEIASEEVEVENKLLNNLNAPDIDCTTESVWGKTLYHINDAPFTPINTPLTSKSFRLNLTKNTEVRDLFDTPDDLSNCVEFNDWGTIPTDQALGFQPEEMITNKNAELTGGEESGLQRIQYYLYDSELLTSYRWTRNRSLGMDYSSKFSPWMALGSLSPRKIYWEVKNYEKTIKKNISTWWLIFEVVWRDFFKYSTLRHGKKIFFKGGIKDRKTAWKYNRDLFDRWRFGQTGIPFIDAHMRELNATGFMSNRGRVNCASFLTRDYQIDWRWGAAWFETQLLDYDVCSNWLNWNTQATEIWYTNPVHQGLKYDKSGEYVKTWLPELSNIEGPIVQGPWLITEEQRKKFSIKSYPVPHEIYKKWTRSINNIIKEQTKFENKNPNTSIPLTLFPKKT